MFARIKKDQKKTYMMSAEGHLKTLFQRLDHDYNEAHGNSEEDSGIDTGSERGAECQLKLAAARRNLEEEVQW